MNIADEAVNRPRNLIVLDATTPVEFSFDQYGKPVVLTIHQTAAENTWPGGALWDCGWCMAQLLVRSSTTTTVIEQPPPSNNNIGKKTQKPRRTSTYRSIPRHLHLPFTSSSTKINTVLELGCGVGLTGLVAAAILRPRIITILTDLPVVIDHVTQRNLQANGMLVDKKTKSYCIQSGGCPVRAMPLCWGNADDEATVREALGGRAPDLVRSFVGWLVKENVCS
jgi:Lysine methyltransferase